MVATKNTHSMYYLCYDLGSVLLKIPIRVCSNSDVRDVMNWREYLVVV